jgi:hypothetical protein
MLPFKVSGTYFIILHPAVLGMTVFGHPNLPFNNLALPASGEEGAVSISKRLENVSEIFTRLVPTGTQLFNTNQSAFNTSITRSVP